MAKQVWKKKLEQFYTTLQNLDTILFTVSIQIIKISARL